MTGNSSRLLKKSWSNLVQCFSLCNLRGSLCLGGTNCAENTHHRGTEIAQRTTEKDLLMLLESFFSSCQESEKLTIIRQASTKAVRHLARRRG